MTLDKSLDPTAGERARAAARYPSDAHTITDPTDPRFGTTEEVEDTERGEETQPRQPDDTAA